MFNNNNYALVVIASLNSHYSLQEFKEFEDKCLPVAESKNAEILHFMPFRIDNESKIKKMHDDIFYLVEIFKYRYFFTSTNWIVNNEKLFGHVVQVDLFLEGTQFYDCTYREIFEYPKFS